MIWRFYTLSINEKSKMMTMRVLYCSWRHGDLLRPRWNHHGDRDDRRGLVAGLRPRRPLWNVPSQLRGIDLASSPGRHLPTWTTTPPSQIIAAAASAHKLGGTAVAASCSVWTRVLHITGQWAAPNCGLLKSFISKQAVPWCSDVVRKMNA